jgi:hypothetical protein
VDSGPAGADCVVWPRPGPLLSTSSTGPGTDWAQVGLLPGVDRLVQARTTPWWPAAQRVR